MLPNCLFAFFKSLACHALQTETIIKKIIQPKLPKTKNKRTKFVMSQTKDKLGFYYLNYILWNRPLKNTFYFTTITSSVNTSLISLPPLLHMYVCMYSPILKNGANVFLILYCIWTLPFQRFQFWNNQLAPTSSKFNPKDTEKTSTLMTFSCV